MRNEPILRPEHWVGLRKPEKSIGYAADAVVVMTRLVPLIGRHRAEVTFRPGRR